jgi:hypothetical protein
MSTDPEVIAADTVAFLTPLLPILIKVGNDPADEAGARLGADVWHSARSIWSRLQPAIGADPRATAAVLELAAAPDDDDLRAQLRVQLRRLVAKDVQLAESLRQLLAAAPPARISITGIVHPGDVIGGNQIGMVWGDCHPIGSGLDELPSSPPQTADKPPPVE